MIKFRTPKYIRILDIYLKYPIFVDLLIIILVITGISILQEKKVILDFDQQILKSINSDLISVSISLAGFVLAALTIIVTFKDSSIQKTEQEIDKKNARVLFFNSKHYFPTVKIFYRASLILLFVFFCLTTLKLIDNNICGNIFQNIVIGCLILIVLTVLRSLYLLLLIIKIQVKSDEKNI